MVNNYGSGCGIYRVVTVTGGTIYPSQVGDKVTMGYRDLLRHVWGITWGLLRLFLAGFLEGGSAHSKYFPRVFTAAPRISCHLQRGSQLRF